MHLGAVVHGPPLEVVQLDLGPHEELDEVAGRSAEPRPHELHGFLLDFIGCPLMFIGFY